MDRGEYTWNNSYILPFESNWGIREKFCKLNCITRREYHKLKINVLVYSQYFSKYFKNYYGHSTNCNYIRYCPECIKYGYHSYFHQFLGFRHCFIHNKTLLIKTDLLYNETILDTESTLPSFSFYPRLRINDLLYSDFLKENLLRYKNNYPASSPSLFVAHFAGEEGELQKFYYESMQSIYEHWFFNSKLKVNQKCRILIEMTTDKLIKLNSSELKQFVLDFCEQRGEKNPDISFNDVCQHIGIEKRENKIYVVLNRIESMYFGVYVGKLIKKYFGNIQEFYRRIDELKGLEKRLKKYNTQYAYAIAFMSILVADREIYFARPIEHWPSWFDCFPIYTAISYFNPGVFDFKGNRIFMYKNNEPLNMICRFYVLKDAIDYIAKRIMKAFRTGELDVRQRDFLYNDELKNVYAVPNYIMVKNEENWYLYACDP